MKYNWVIYVVVLFILAVTYPVLSSFEETSALSAVSGVASFLFGLQAAYTIKDRHARSNHVNKNGSIERAELVVIKDCMKSFPEKDQTRILHHIDEYLMASMDLSRSDFYLTEKEYTALFDAVRELKFKTETQKILFTRMIQALETIEKTRKHTIALFLDTVSKSEWVILSFLIILIYISLIAGSAASVVSLILAIGLALIATYLMVVAILFDSLKWRLESRIIEPFQKTFEALGLPRYYSQPLIDDGSITEYKTLRDTYRVGQLKNYPDTSQRKVRLIKP